MINLAVSGCYGRMGERITCLGLNDKTFQIKTLLERPDHPKAGEPFSGIPVQTAPEALKDSDVLIEFTTPDATLKNLDMCVKLGKKMVIGTTGFNEQQISRIKKASKQIPVVFSSNMSVGVNILFKLTEILAKAAPEIYNVRMTEAHHIHKKDAPSGTAKTLAQMIEKNSSHRVTDIKSIREGEIIGDHEVVFESGEDIIAVRHSAKTRDIFAKGALVAAKFLQNKTQGLFDMQDVLGLK